MEKPRFELLEHTADIILRAHGRDENELFANAAYGLFNVIGETAGVRATVEKRVSLRAEDRESLFVAWLSELLFLFETSGLFFAEFECAVKDGELRATARGEKFDAQKHAFKTEIKAVTRHELRVEKNAEEWTVTALLDL